MKQLKADSKKAYLDYINTPITDTTRKKKNKTSGLLRAAKRKNMNILKVKKYKKLDYLFNYNLIEFWRKVKNLKQIRENYPIEIDTLKEEYKSLFNDKIMGGDEQNEKNSQDKVNKFLFEERNHTYDDDEIKKHINEDKLESIIKHLPNGKSAGASGVTYEMIKYGIEPVKINRYMGEKYICYLMIIILLMYTTMFKYSVVPDGLNDAIIHLLKDRKKSKTDKNNYRPISLSEPFGGIFEKISNNLITKIDFGDEQQFGFRSNSSCQHAVFCVNEAIRHSRNNNLELFLVAIDASKAFDKVNRPILFAILIDHLPAFLIKIIIVYYCKSRSKVRLNGKFSAYFTTTRGVKQGGQMSPTLFTIYAHPIIKRITSLGYGVFITINILICIILYADDILLLCNYYFGMRAMLKVVEQFGLDYEIKFNGDKSQLMIVNYKGENEYRMELNNKQLERVRVIKYLGILIQDNFKNELHIEDRISKVSKALLSIKNIGLYNLQLSAKLIVRLYTTYLRPILTYGLDTISLTSTQADDLATFENNMIKKMLGVSICCHLKALLFAIHADNSDRYDHFIIFEYFILFIFANKISNFKLLSIIRNYKLCDLD
jgi:hypothetical protein